MIENILMVSILLAAAMPSVVHSPEYNTGYNHGVSDAKNSPNILPPLKADEIDCEDFPDAKVGVIVPDFCAGYRDGFVAIINAK
jgi:hypothetical protein